MFNFNDTKVSDLAGLLREDLYMEEDPIVEEAIRRLPEKEQDQRLFRIKRALDLSMKKNILPRDQWTTEEQVPKVLYLYNYMYNMRINISSLSLWAN